MPCGKAQGTVAKVATYEDKIINNSWKTTISTTVYSFVSKKKSNIKLENWLVGY